MQEPEEAGKTSPPRVPPGRRGCLGRREVLQWVWAEGSPGRPRENLLSEQPVFSSPSHLPVRVHGTAVGVCCSLRRTVHSVPSVRASQWCRPHQSPRDLAKIKTLLQWPRLGPRLCVSPELPGDTVGRLVWSGPFRSLHPHHSVSITVRNTYNR